MQALVGLFHHLVQAQEDGETLKLNIYLTVATFSFMIAKSWEKPKCVLVWIWLINSGAPVHTMEYCLKGREDSIYTYGMISTMLNEKKQESESLVITIIFKKINVMKHLPIYKKICLE